MAKIVELIMTDYSTGKGVEDDPCRIVKQLWTKDGDLVAVHDSHLDHESLNLDLIKDY